MLFYYYNNAPDPHDPSTPPPIPNTKPPARANQFGKIPVTDSGSPGTRPSPNDPNERPPYGLGDNPKKVDTQKENLQDSIPPMTDHAGTDKAHPIDRLIYNAQLQFAEIVSKESKNVENAAQAYRKRRGRHPPPGFNVWYEFAQNNSAIVVEDFFDQVYHDLQPFWGLEPATLRKESWDYEMTINIRDRVASTGSDWFWTVIWLDLIKSIEHLLPDMDISLNAMDEPRLVAPWEDIERYMRKAAKTVHLPKAKDVRSDSQKLAEPGKVDLMVETRDKVWEDTSEFSDSLQFPTSQG